MQYIFSLFWIRNRENSEKNKESWVHKYEHDIPVSENVEWRDTSMKKYSLTSEEKETLTNLIPLIRTLLARGNSADAQTKIVEGLSLDKENRELNLLLADIYEKNGDYRRAEIIYKDLIPIYWNDSDIYERLGETLMKQEKYDIAYEVYSKLIGFTSDVEKVIFPLTFVTFHLGKMEEVLEYGKQYLHNHPYDPDILWVVAQAEAALGEREDALERLTKLRQLSPYDTTITDMIERVRCMPSKWLKNEETREW